MATELSEASNTLRRAAKLLDDANGMELSVEKVEQARDAAEEVVVALAAILERWQRYED